MYLIKSLTRACKLVNDQIRTRLPIHKGLLNMLIKRVQQRYLDLGQNYLSVMYSCLLSTAYYRLFRVSELTSGVHPVLACDVQIAKNKKKSLFILRTSKTHGKSAKPQMVKISSLDKNARKTNLGKKGYESFGNAGFCFCP